MFEIRDICARDKSIKHMAHSVQTRGSVYKHKQNTRACTNFLLLNSQYKSSKPICANRVCISSVHVCSENGVCSA